MFESFYVDTHNLTPFGGEHQFVLWFFLIFGFYFIYSGTKRWSQTQKRKYALMLAAFMAFTQLFKTFIRLGLGNYDQTTDLPFHLCSLMPFVMLYVYYNKSRNVWAIFFFWIIAGTFQAMFTITLTDVLPHYEAIRYWLVHAGGVILAIYGFFAFGWRFKYSDVFKSGIAMNVAALIIYPLNLMLGSNYFYLNGKPPGTTLYSILPEWPYYILCLEGVLLVLFTTVYLFFMGPSIFSKYILKNKSM